MLIMKLYLFDLDFDPITLVLKPDLNIGKMYVFTKNEVPSFSGSHVVAQKGRHTGRHIDKPTQLKLLPTRICKW